eukprot:GHVU01169949.1.p2 GENE.GHVU01169949.1~~GHVU01169949.1.p2  ORF type:complete len:127 (-),score=16.05 GHVU01169949.1:998-1378(-)
MQQESAKSILETLSDYRPTHELPESTAKWQAIMEHSAETTSLLSVGGIMNTEVDAIKRTNTRRLTIKEPSIVVKGDELVPMLLPDDLKAEPTVKSNVKGQLKNLLRQFQQFIQDLSLHVETGLSER